LTQKEEITILPQPKLSLSYYIPGEITAGEPFRMGVVADNAGNGTANNLMINSGQLEIKTEKSGLLTRFDIMETSFGSKSGNNFSLNLGNIEPHSSVSGYWIVRWLPYEDGEMTEGEKDLKGEFKSFKASLTHSDYNGIQLNPLIVDIKTEILGRDNLFADGTGNDGILSLIDVGQTGFPNYLINISTGLKLPIYVPETLKVVKQPDLESNTMEFSVPSNDGNPDQPGMPKYQVLMLKDPSPGTSVNEVTRIVEGEEEVYISKNNIWKNNGNIFIVDSIPIKTDKPENYDVEQERYYYPSYYSVDFSSGARLDGIEYARIYYDTDPKTLYKYPKYAYYDIGVCTSEGELTSVRAAVNNQGVSIENVTVEFFAARINTRGLEENEIKIGEGRVSNLKPFRSEYVYCNWKPEQAGDYILKARITGEEFETANTTKAHINYIPYADAGVDFSVDVGKPARFDGSRSHDKDGYIQSFIWDFGNGQSGTGVAPVYTYNDSGTYKVKLTVMDSDFVESTSQMQITVRETRPDLRVTDVKISNEKPEEGERISITATIHNGGESDTDKPFIVGLYSNNMFKDSVKIEDIIKKGETKIITFERTYMSGEYLITVVANDMGRPFDEADFDNNQRSVVLSVENSFMADIRVKDFWIDMPEDGVLDWNQDVKMTAIVENTGEANAEKFSVVFYADDKLVEAKQIKQLMYLSDYGNTVEVTAVWNAKTEGVHRFKVVADGFVPRVVEINRNDNEMEIESPDVRLRYPDLVIKGASVDGLTMEQGQEMILNLEVGNDGYADVNRPFSVSAYAGEHYIGTKEIEKIKKNSTAHLVFIWNKPVEGVEDVKFIVDDYRKISESNEKNN
ncbi:MAG: PKD domain-containing protein, partial [Clostridiaceae bacterium]|nr:PKD domain-containing protein [Clostridiaceae bacterium]